MPYTPSSPNGKSNGIILDRALPVPVTCGTLLGVAETPDESAELRQEIAELKDTVRVLTDAVDALREELQWITRNGLPSQQASRNVPVLKQMAANPTVDDWSEHLVIARGESDRGSDQPEQSASSGPADHPPPGNPDGSDTLF